IDVDPAATPAVGATLVATTLLTDETGHRFIGDSGAIDRAHPDRSARLDPEGLRVSPTRSYFLSDEYGPRVLEFDQSGKLLRPLPVPPKFAIAQPDAKAERELPPHNRAGRQVNRGFEGLAITPDGAK